MATVSTTADGKLPRRPWYRSKWKRKNSLLIGLSAIAVGNHIIVKEKLSGSVVGCAVKNLIEMSTVSG
jgi:hypothetical protein